MSDCNSCHLWLRAEQKEFEQRCALNPLHAQKLVQAGFKISVECSSQRIIADDLYAQAGCQMVEQGSWPDAPPQAWILGLKELADDDFPLTHRHIHFAHVYKEQPGAERTLQRFKSGGGALYDLEFLVNEQRQRVAAFGYWAGFAGAAVAVQTWSGQILGRQPPLAALQSFPDKNTMLQTLSGQLDDACRKAGRVPQSLVIGALGRSGLGAAECIESLGLSAIKWDIEETRSGGPFSEILDADIFLNCVLVNSPIKPFLEPRMLDDERSLSVICDVSCDPGSEFNPLPVYDSCTTFAQPLHRLRADPLLDLISIDHLPSLLPLESSNDFIEQLSSHFHQLEQVDGSGQHTVWDRALKVFQQKIASLPA